MKFFYPLSFGAILKAFLRKRNSKLMTRISYCNPLCGSKHRTSAEALPKGVTFTRATDYTTVSDEDVFTPAKNYLQIRVSCL